MHEREREREREGERNKEMKMKTTIPLYFTIHSGTQALTHTMMQRTTSDSDLKHSTAKKRKRTTQKKKSTHTLHVQLTQGTFGLYLRQSLMLLLESTSEK